VTKPHPAQCLADIGANVDAQTTRAMGIAYFEHLERRYATLTFNLLLISAIVNFRSPPQFVFFTLPKIYLQVEKQILGSGSKPWRTQICDPA
jgi:hypothetical protein